MRYKYREYSLTMTNSMIPCVFKKSSEQTTKLAAPSQMPDAVPLKMNKV